MRITGSIFETSHLSIMWETGSELQQNGHRRFEVQHNGHQGEHGIEGQQASDFLQKVSRLHLVFLLARPYSTRVNRS